MPWGTYEIVGVAGSVKQSALDVEAAPTIYFAYPSDPLVIRSNLPMSELTKWRAARMNPAESLR